MSRTKLVDPPAEVIHSDPLHIKYRPKSLKDVIGQDKVVDSLRSALKASARPHTFLFTGPGGTGKTTLARIVAAQFGVDGMNLLEVDAASNSGIDDMRRVTDALKYNGFGDSPNKAIIIDECQGLSKQAWDSLLKSTEQPPQHVFFFFCSTNPGKIPAPMLTRCLNYSLQPVRYDDLMDLLEGVCDAEGYKTPTDILEVVARAADGSPRAALTGLAKVYDCVDSREAADLLATALDNAEVIDLCRMLLKGDLAWDRLCETLKAMEETGAESIRIIITNYLNKVLLNAKSERDILRLLELLEAFSKPCNPSDKLAPILIAFGRVIYP